MHKRYTISEIKALNEAAGGRFFSRENMKFAGDTMTNFIVCNETDSHHQLTGRIFIIRKEARKPHVPLSMWQFDTTTHRLSLMPDRK